MTVTCVGDEDSSEEGGGGVWSTSDAVERRFADEVDKTGIVRNWMVGGGERGGGWVLRDTSQVVVGLTGCMGSGCLKDPSLKKQVMNSVWGW